MLKSSFRVSHNIILFSLQILLLIGIVMSSVYFVLKPDFLNYAFAIPTDQVTVVLSTWALPTYPKGISDIISDFASNMFYSFSSANKIVRVEPTTNMITEWTLPANSSKPAGIAFDTITGNIYFTDSGANKIGRLVPTTNVITEWTLPSESGNSSGFSDIAFDSTSGSVYFIENNGNIIGRLVPSTNTFTEWALSPRSAKVSSLSSGFGGLIYFSDSGANKIVRLEPATNMITEWTLPDNSSKPIGIAFDSTTGNIYFADSGANKIGRLVPTTNVITEWNIDKSPLALSVTPGGSIYYIDDVGGMGRLG